jgi:hypothetical protein
MAPPKVPLAGADIRMCGLGPRIRLKSPADDISNDQ